MFPTALLEVLPINFTSIVPDSNAASAPKSVMMSVLLREQIGANMASLGEGGGGFKKLYAVDNSQRRPTPTPQPPSFLEPLWE